MKMTDIISECDRIKPNEYSFDAKKKWLQKIEADVVRYASMYSNTHRTVQTSENPQLFLEDEFSDVYLYYLISMIDLSNQEYMLYNNSASYFNSVFNDWKKHYRRTNLPQCNSTIHF